MIKRTLYFGNEAYLHTRDQQLVIEFTASDKPSAKVPIEDIGVVVFDSPRLTFSQRLISRLLDNNVAVITCNDKHMPQGLLLNLDGNSVHQERFRYQIEASQPLKKNLWQQTVRAKILNQHALLKTLHPENPHDNMLYWAKSVRSGDADNHEARAAAYYWSTLFSKTIPHFVRGRYEADPNNLLNYGYAILRAITARALVASGMLPVWGIHHHNKYNAYALADDIMEPYRPYVDKIVYQLISTRKPEGFSYPLTTDVKADLLQLPVVDVIIDNEKSPLMVAMQRTTASLYRCFEGSNRKILYPTFS